MEVWVPIDCTLGAGYEDKENPGVFKRQFDPLYFAIPPEYLIYTHRPDNDQWQLLQSPHSLESFKDRIAPNAHYFHLGKC